jgi:hypothetical protein
MGSDSSTVLAPSAYYFFNLPLGEGSADDTGVGSQITPESINRYLNRRSGHRSSDFHRDGKVVSSAGGWCPDQRSSRPERQPLR